MSDIGTILERVDTRIGAFVEHIDSRFDTIMEGIEVMQAELSLLRPVPERLEKVEQKLDLVVEVVKDHSNRIAKLESQAHSH